MKITIQPQGSAFWHIECFVPGCDEAINLPVCVGSPRTLYRLLGYYGATDQQLESVRVSLRRQGGASVNLSIPLGKRNLLRIKPEFQPDC